MSCTITLDRYYALRLFQSLHNWPQLLITINYNSNDIAKRIVERRQIGPSDYLRHE